MNILYKGMGAMLMVFSSIAVFAQTSVSGKVTDAVSGEPIAGVNIVVKGRVIGTVTGANGEFSLKANDAPPITLVLSFIGYRSQEIQVADANTTGLEIKLEEQTVLGQEIVVSASRVEESILQSPVSIEKMDILQVQATPSENYYKGLINMKGLDMTQSSINFQIVNARGFNSTGNTRFVQLTDGMDTQAPALNFPIGNLNGPSELDVESVEFLPGASSALYGPNAFNGILLVNSKSPFEYQGLSAFAKFGMNHFGGTEEEPSSPQPMYETSLRYAKSFNNRFAFKVTFSYSKAEDWYGTNFTDKNPERTPADFTTNPGSDLVHAFGDEAALNIGLLGFSSGFQATAQASGLDDYLGDLPNNVISRTPYKEKYLVDYGAENLKAGGSIHYRPTDKLELIYALNYGFGTSVYTGAQRYALSNFSITQHKLELKGDNFFVRGYTTLENSGDSYIADLIGFQINNDWKNNTTWFGAYGIGYLTGLKAAMDAAGLSPGQSDQLPAPILEMIHSGARGAADNGRVVEGTPAFETLKSKYKNQIIPQGGKFDDNSNLYHVQGQYDFKNEIKFMDLLVGASYRLFDLNSNGTIFADVPGNNITINEYGAYAQASKTISNLKLTGSLRYDKNENFEGQFSPRISGVYTVANDHNFRASFQTGFRNPTSQAQHIDLNVVSAQLIGGLQYYADKYQITNNTYTIESVNEYTGRVLAAGSSSAIVDPANIAVLQRFDTFNEVKPEQIKSFEVGYKGLLSDQKLMIDLSYYYNLYNDFEYQTRVRRAVGDVNANAINASSLLSGDNTNTYQIYTNATEEVTSQGAAIGITYNLPKSYTISTNYSWNSFDKNDNDNSGIYQFNTPEHKVNFTFANRKLTDRLGFAVTWRWQDEFLWEASFANGIVPAFSTVDAQVSYKVPPIKSTVKLGGSNLFNERYIMNYGAPTIGAIYYVSVTFDQLFNK
jgi:iron complex outermembrane receptor protein